MSDGSVLHWEDVGNVTAVVTLPEIGNPDMPVFAVMSLMMKDGSVVQVAAGVQKNSTSWAVFADFDTDVESMVPNYQQVLNASQPVMAQNDTVAISIFRSATDDWYLEVKDLQSGTAVVGQFPTRSATALRSGDQEAFALESYSTNEATFENMGSLTMNALFVDGSQVARGLYGFGDWAPARNPLFVVGGAGTSPPDFVSLWCGNGSAVWSHVVGLGSAEASYMPPPQVSFLLPLAFGLGTVAACWLLLSRMRTPLERSQRRPAKNQPRAD
jgi:hypothetical protein